MNDRVKITLTEYGSVILNNFTERRMLGIKGAHPVYKEVGDEIEFQLWELFQIFGPEISFTMGQVPFLNNEIKFI